MINNPNAMQLAVAEKQTQTGGDWFFWIAGLSVINAVMMVMHVPIGFFFSLGVIDYAIHQHQLLGTGVLAAGMLLIIALCGLFARRGMLWAFLVGMVLYVLDALFCLWLGQYLGLWEYLEGAFHAYALFRIFQGFQAAQRLGILRAEQAAISSGSYGTTPGVWPPPPNA